MDCFNVYIIIDSSSEKFTGKWMTKLPVLSGKRICTILELLSCIPRLCRTMIMWSLVHLAFWNFFPNLCTDNKNLLWIICFLTSFLLLFYWVFEKRGQREVLVLVLGHVLVIISRLSCFLAFFWITSQIKPAWFPLLEEQDIAHEFWTLVTYYRSSAHCAKTLRDSLFFPSNFT